MVAWDHEECAGSWRVRHGLKIEPAGLLSEAWSMEWRKGLGSWPGGTVEGVASGEHRLV